MIDRQILIVEDDLNIAALIERYLSDASFDVIVEHDGRDGLDRFHSQAFDLVILDVMLPRLDGWDICRAIRKTSNVPVLMLTARSDEVDRIMGFSLGADDYVVKPFSPREVVERVKAIMRRTVSTTSEPVQKSLRCGAIEINPVTHEATFGGDALKLTLTEYRLLEIFLRQPGRVYSRSDLLDRLCDKGEVVIDRVVDVLVSNLRKKIDTDIDRPRFIETVRGIGYRLRAPDVELRKNI